ncbi:MAG: IS1 family transposase [Deltaproteobacteria bacterium]|nr:IS1 family transposase [Deltaproteobacteria bacterium]
MSSKALSLKKSKCWIWVALDFTVGKVLGFVCGSRSIKTARELFKQLKDLPTMGYGTDFLKTYEHLIPTALHPQGKTFTTQIESLNCRFRYCLARLHRRTLC